MLESHKYEQESGVSDVQSKCILLTWVRSSPLEKINSSSLCFSSFTLPVSQATPGTVLDRTTTNLSINRAL